MANVTLRVVEISASRQWANLKIVTHPSNLIYDLVIDDSLCEEKDEYIIVQENGLEEILRAVLKRLDEKPEFS
jgi:hypothetical protein